VRRIKKEGSIGNQNNPPPWEGFSTEVSTRKEWFEAGKYIILSTYTLTFVT